MCVIAIVDDTRPNERHVEAMWDANDHGGGVAWFEDGKVKWDKGLELVHMQEYVKTLPTPFVMHFRIASCGGRSPLLTHPFVINPEVPLELEGSSAEDPILFHNGHLQQWEEMTVNYSARRGYKIPKGKWSDTRAVALIAAHYGTGILDFLHQKFVVMDPLTQDIETYGDFTFSDGFLVSNQYWSGRYDRLKRFLEPRAPGIPAPVAAPGAHLPAQTQVLQEKPTTLQIAHSGAITPVDTALACSFPKSPERTVGEVMNMSGGGAAERLPFRNNLEHYEALERAGKLSKNGLKRIRRWFAGQERAKKVLAFKTPETPRSTAILH